MTTALTPHSVKAFQTSVTEWWGKNARRLPWRDDPSPYHVLVSEVMLQQTQVSRVVPKYLEFLEEFPTLEALASADTKRLLQVWSGLGYNRRALWLRECAQQIVGRKEFPSTIDELKSLKGIGPYTSRSILIFAFNADLATVDTNIRRVLIASGFADECMTDKELQEIAVTLLPRGDSRNWHNALMDYGSAILTSSSTGISPRGRQSRFSGSTRETRGAILRILMDSEPLDLEAISSELGLAGYSASCLEPIINRLISDGLVELTETMRYSIPEGKS